MPSFQTKALVVALISGDNLKNQNHTCQCLEKYMESKYSNNRVKRIIVWKQKSVLPNGNSNSSS